MEPGPQGLEHPPDRRRQRRRRLQLHRRRRQLPRRRARPRRQRRQLRRSLVRRGGAAERRLRRRERRRPQRDRRRRTPAASTSPSRCSAAATAPSCAPAPCRRPACGCAWSAAARSASTTTTSPSRPPGLVSMRGMVPASDYQMIVYDPTGMRDTLLVPGPYTVVSNVNGSLGNLTMADAPADPSEGNNTRELQRRQRHRRRRVAHGSAAAVAVERRAHRAARRRRLVLLRRRRRRSRHPHHQHPVHLRRRDPRIHPWTDPLLSFWRGARVTRLVENDDCHRRRLRRPRRHRAAHRRLSLRRGDHVRRRQLHRQRPDLDGRVHPARGHGQPAAGAVHQEGRHRGAGGAGDLLRSTRATPWCSTSPSATPITTCRPAASPTSTAAATRSPAAPSPSAPRPATTPGPRRPPAPTAAPTRCGCRPPTASSTRRKTVILVVNAVDMPPPVPVLVSPMGGAVVTTGAPALTWNNAADPDGDTVTYDVELYEDGVGGAPAQTASAVVEGAGGVSTWVPATIAENVRVSWRVRARGGTGLSPWSEYGELPGRLGQRRARDAGAAQAGAGRAPGHAAAGAVGAQRRGSRGRRRRVRVRDRARPQLHRDRSGPARRSRRTRCRPPP